MKEANPNYTHNQTTQALRWISQLKRPRSESPKILSSTKLGMASGSISGRSWKSRQVLRGRSIPTCRSQSCQSLSQIRATSLPQLHPASSRDSRRCHRGAFSHTYGPKEATKWRMHTPQSSDPTLSSSWMSSFSNSWQRSNLRPLSISIKPSQTSIALRPWPLPSLQLPSRLRNDRFLNISRNSYKLMRSQQH